MAWSSWWKVPVATTGGVDRVESIELTGVRRAMGGELGGASLVGRGWQELLSM